MLDPEMILLWKGIRRLWTSFSKNRRALLDSTVVKKPMIKKDGAEGKTMLNYWPCAHCGELVRERDVDHIIPVGLTPTCDEEVAAAVGMLFCPIDNLQTLCKKCHKIKSKEDVKKMHAFLEVALPIKKTRRAKCSKNSTNRGAPQGKHKKKRSTSSKKTGRGMTS